MTYCPVLKDNNITSLKEFLNNLLIELLPNQDIIIANHLNLIKYLENNPSLYILRKFKNHNKRGKIYSFQDLSFTVSDNEPALWVFMESFNNSKLDFIDIIQNQKLPIAFALNSDERLESEWANVGRKHIEFSKNGWKHCHILQCAPSGSTIEKRDDLKKRCLRLLSPINHFPFFSPKRFEMPYDYGEDMKCIELVIWWLYNNFYDDVNKEIFKEFIESQSFKVSAEEPDDILLDLEYKDLKEERKNKKSEKIKMNNELNIFEIEVKSYFKISKNWYNQNKVIRVQFLNGNYIDNIYEYNHDEVYNICLKYLSNLPCWHKDGYYSNSRNIPGWAKDYVRQI